MRNGRGYASECLPNAKEEIEVTGSLRNELSRGGLSVHLVCHRLETGKCGRIQIVTEIQANGTDRSLVMHPHSDRVRHVVKVALGIGALVETDAGRPRQDKAFRGRTVPANEVVVGILHKKATEVGLRTEVTRSYSGIERGVHALGGVKGIVAAVADKGKSGNSNPRRLRQD